MDEDIFLVERIFYARKNRNGPDVIAPDGEEQDVYILGVDAPIDVFTGKIIAVIRRKNDVEDKWVAAPMQLAFTEKEIRDMTDFQERYFDIEIET